MSGPPPRRREASLALLALAASLSLGLAGPLAGVEGADPARAFQAANESARSTDYPKAISAYAAIAASGVETAPLYWNWAQAAAARGHNGEALWALLRARELDPGDRAVGREIERMREALNLDRAEIAPEPLAAAARASRRLRLDLVAAILLLLSLVAHALARFRETRGAFVLCASLLVLGLVAGVLPLAGALARPTAGVVRRDAPLFEAASPTAEPAGVLREGEVVPVLEASGEWLRVEDNAGARGWVREGDVRRLERAPRSPQG